LRPKVGLWARPCLRTQREERAGHRRRSAGPGRQPASPLALKASRCTRGANTRLPQTQSRAVSPSGTCRGIWATPTWSRRGGMRCSPIPPWSTW